MQCQMELIIGESELMELMAVGAVGQLIGILPSRQFSRQPYQH